MFMLHNLLDELVSAERINEKFTIEVNIIRQQNKNIEKEQRVHIIFK